MPAADIWVTLIVSRIFFFNDTATTEIYTLSLHDALPICGQTAPCGISRATGKPWCPACQRRRAGCSACGRREAIASGTLDTPLCSGCTPPPPWAGCPVCSDPDHPSPGQCARCLINARLEELMGPGD